MKQSVVLFSIVAIALFGHALAQGAAGGGLPEGVGGVGDEESTATVSMIADFEEGLFEELPEGEELERPEQPILGNLERLCDCVEPELEGGLVRVSNIREISNEFCDGGDSGLNSFGLSNMVWAFGQFIDHDVVGSDEEIGRPEEVEDILLDLPNRIQPLSRLGPELGDADDGICEGQENTHTGLIDGHPIYTGSEEGEAALRDLESCYLLVTANPEGENGDFLPLGGGGPGGLEEQTPPAQGVFLIAGDRRVNEHTVLATMHTIWLREHNRLCAEVENNPTTANLPPDDQFEIAKDTVIAKMQTITVNEFLPALGITEDRLRDRADEGFNVSGTFATVEFSIAYRLGHTLIPDRLGNFELDELFRAEERFLQEEANGEIVFNEEADLLVDSLAETLATTSASEIDGMMSNALRNVLFGPPAPDFEGPLVQLDLCSFNLFRGRDLFIPSYAGLAECLGVEPDLATEQQTPDPWLGLLREPKPADQVLPPTLEEIVVEHFSRILFGPEGSFVGDEENGMELRMATMIFAEEIEQTTLGQVISNNTGVTLNGNVFMV